MRLKREQTIRAHRVDYKGYLFRSKLEVRWAFFFDKMGISWEYEAKGYRMAPTSLFPIGCGYIPDFFFDFCIAEVKPDEPTGEEIAKALGVVGVERKPFYFLIGRPGEKQEIRIIQIGKQGKIEFGIIPSEKAFKVSATTYRNALVQARKITFVPKKKGTRNGREG
jgi:hypothetical protein